MTLLQINDIYIEREKTKEKFVSDGINIEDFPFVHQLLAPSTTQPSPFFGSGKPARLVEQTSILAVNTLL